MELRQHAIETCVTAMLLDMTRLFKSKAYIENVGDKRYWESRLLYNDKQFTSSASDIKVNFYGEVTIDNSQNTSPTEINYLYLDKKDIKPLSIKCRRKTLTLPLQCKTNSTTFTGFLDALESFIDKVSDARTFHYVIFGKQFAATYKIQNDLGTENKASFSMDEQGDNGFDITFRIELEMHYYAPIYRSAILSDMHVTNTIVVTEVVTGQDENGNDIITEVETEVPVIITDDTDIIDADQDIIRHLVHNIYLKQDNEN